MAKEEEEEVAAHLHVCYLYDRLLAVVPQVTSPIREMDQQRQCTMSLDILQCKQGQKSNMMIGSKQA